MKLPLAPDAANLVEWLRSLAAGIAAGWNVEHTDTGGHKWTWTDVAYDAKRFTGNGSMTWTVDSDDHAMYRYGRLGDLMYVTFRFASTDVGGTASTGLQIALPNGYRGNGYAWGSLIYSDAGTVGTGTCQMLPDGRLITCYKSNQANWTLTTSDNTTLNGTLLFPVTKD